MIPKWMQKVVVAGLTSAIAATVMLVVHAQGISHGDSERILSLDHYVPVKSKVPGLEGELTQVYVRERARAATVLRSTSLRNRVVLFVHGAGTPAEVAFDPASEGYSWMAYLANAGFDTFAMDMTGYGRSTRPAPMNDPCNFSSAQQESLMPALLEATCTGSYPFAMTTIASDWHDLNTVVMYLKKLRNVDRVSLVAWSLGGPRVGGYTAAHPENVHKLVLLAPAYSRRPREEPTQVPVPGPAMTKQTRADFVSNWDRQVGCENQYHPDVSETVWAEMLASDPVGATWGPGLRRAPRTTVWGWTSETVAQTQTPTLIVAGVHDAQVPQERARQLHEDLGTTHKVFVDLGCASHNAMWEQNRTLLFEASREWLAEGSVNGAQEGILRMGY